MSFRTSLILFFIFMAVGIASFNAVRKGLYPVAIVNFDIITARTIEKDTTAAFAYYQNALLTYGKDLNSVDKNGMRQEIKRAVIDKLVTDSLIYNELSRRVSKSEFQNIADRKIDQFVADNKNIREASVQLYGLDFEDFKQRVLMPQAYQEILAGRMFLDNEDFNEWLGQKKNNCRIFILTPEFDWDKEKIILR